MIDKKKIRLIIFYLRMTHLNSIINPVVFLKLINPIIFLELTYLAIFPAN